MLYPLVLFFPQFVLGVNLSTLGVNKSTKNVNLSTLGVNLSTLSLIKAPSVGAVFSSISPKTARNQVVLKGFVKRFFQKLHKNHQLCKLCKRWESI